MDLPIEDVPKSVMDEVGCDLQNYLVPILGLRPENAEPRLRLIGSGTLVDVEGTHHILTAAHVWHRSSDAEQIVLPIADYASSFSIRREHISAKELWRDSDNEWGPDLALLTLAAPFVSRIKAHKSFVNLAQQRLSHAVRPSVTAKGFWAISGMVGKFSEVQPSPNAKIIEANIHARTFFSLMHQIHQRNGYDYLDLGAKLCLPGVPSDFGGASGGGLWEVGLLRTKSGEITWNGRRKFRGVAFWQLADPDGHKVIRCHGPRSIFENAWERWGLPLGR